MTKPFDTTYFRDALETGDPQVMRRALAHLISWHEIYDDAELRTEVAYSDPEKFDGLALTTELYALGIEDTPGITVFEREVTEWRVREKKQILRGQTQHISGDPSCFLPEQ